MSISYSGLTNYGKVTLPSVSDWGTNMSILRDPPKSIYTRRINKVGETSDITAMIDDSENRACQSIRTYALGVNPMVSVSYGQGGGNGVRSGSITSMSGRSEAKLPYRIMDGGAFRPPLMKQQNTYPLSRMPRNTTSAFTNIDFPDFQKKMMCPQPANKTHGVKNTQLKVSVRPTSTIRLETPLIEPFEVKYVIQNPIKVSGNSGMRTRDLTTQYGSIPTKEISKEPIHANVNVNHGSDITITHIDNNNMDTERYVQDPLNKSVQSKIYKNISKFTDNNNMDTERYVQDPLNKSVQSKIYRNISKFTDNNTLKTDNYLQNPVQTEGYSNISHNIQVTQIEDLMDINIKNKNLMNISYEAPKSGTSTEKYIHDAIELQRKRPLSYAQTNKQQDIYIRQEDQYVKSQERNRPMTQVYANHGTVSHQEDVQINRSYNLKPSIKKGGYEGRVQKPIVIRENNIESLKTQKQAINNRVSEQYDGRFTH
jgi:hypothetical protein